jgi:hypothetical protein
MIKSITLVFLFILVFSFISCYLPDMKRDFVSSFEKMEGEAIVPPIEEKEPGQTFFTVNARVGEGGTISPGGEFTVLYNDSVSFTVTPDNEYKILNVTVNGIPVPDQKQRVWEIRIENIQEDLEVIAAFTSNVVLLIFKGDGVLKSWIAPDNIDNNSIYLKIVAGGGGGGGAYQHNSNPYEYNVGEGGHAGECKVVDAFAVTPGKKYSLRAGEGGERGTNGSPVKGKPAGGSGGQESFFRAIEVRGGQGGRPAGGYTSYDQHGEVSEWPGYGNGGRGGMQTRPQNGREGRIEITYTELW